MIYGYARVSTDADLTNQLAELKTAGCDPIFREKIAGPCRARLATIREKCMPSLNANPLKPVKNARITVNPRIGAGGRILDESYGSEALATDALQKHAERKRRRGYV